MKNYIFFIVIIFILCTSCIFKKPEPVSDRIYKEDYRPFKEGTKAVILPETPTLKLRNNLPRLDGATALYPLYAAFVQAVYPKRYYSPYGDDQLVNASTTPYAYENLINGEADIIFCAKPSNEQIEMAEEKGIEFHMTPIGRDAFVFFVNKKNKVSNLTTEQIRNIYSGQITNWSELGGRKNEIRIFQRPKNSGSQTILESIMGGVDIIEPITENVLDGMLDIVNQTAVYRNYRNALGYSFLFYTTQMVMNDKIKLLAIDNVFPSTETIQNGTYPYTDVFYAITTNTKNYNVEDFINWMLSEQGQYLVEKTGYVPIK
ncbi:MAG: substrate-binding domain-containing protein [Treponema sp.]|jgi:phosphate transport system substrate-binding protein|nr:substrate-binding domain-containing protein [Treponema sp.]